MNASQNNVLISVLIPTYNRMEQLSQTLQSVFQQTFDSFEILIIDDGSTEPIQSLAAKDSRIRVVRHETNKGESAARNTGIREAIGKYIAYLDSDDEWLPEKLEIQFNWMEQNPEIKATTTGFCYLTEEGASEQMPRNHKDWFRHLLKGLDLAPGATLMAHTSCMREFPYDLTLPRMADLDWALRFSQKYSFYVIHQSLAIINRDSRPIAATVEKSNLLIIEKYKEAYYTYGQFFGSQSVGKRYLEISTHYFREGNKTKGFHYLKKSVLKNPFQRPGMYLRIVDYLLGTSILVSLKKIRQQLFG